MLGLTQKIWQLLIIQKDHKQILVTQVMVAQQHSQYILYLKQHQQLK